MKSPTEPGAVCSTCGEPLSATGNCLPCLLRGGLGETVAAEEVSAVAAPMYGDLPI